jgi:hypothetical protein
MQTLFIHKQSSTNDCNVRKHYDFDVYYEQSYCLRTQPKPPVLLRTKHFSLTAGNA